MEKMNYRYTIKLLKTLICSLVTLTIFTQCSLEAYSSPQKAVKTIKGFGEIAYANPVSQPPDNEAKPFDWLNAIYKIGTGLLGISALATIIFSIVKKYQWLRKYGKNRTPIVMPMSPMLPRNSNSWIPLFSFIP